MSRVDCRTTPNWLKLTLESVRYQGFAVVEQVLDRSFVGQVSEAMYRVRDRIIREVGRERLERAGEIGVLRLMMKYDPLFLRFLEIPELLSVVDQTVSNTAILHLQNGFILPSSPDQKRPSVFQMQFHQDFRRVLNGFAVSVNAFFAISEFTRESGATLVVPGTHQKEGAPDQEYLGANAQPVECPAGSMIVFDSTLWHASGVNVSGQDRLAINHQFTRSYLKQQIDYVRALGDSIVMAQPPRTQQLLGWYTRVPTSLDEYYRPEDERLYRKGQG